MGPSSAERTEDTAMVRRDAALLGLSAARTCNAMRVHLRDAGRDEV